MAKKKCTLEVTKTITVTPSGRVEESRVVKTSDNRKIQIKKITPEQATHIAGLYLGVPDEVFKSTRFIDGPDPEWYVETARLRILISAERMSAEHIRGDNGGISVIEYLTSEKLYKK